MNARERAIDAVMTYWLSGTHNEDLAEWWMSGDAAECAAELVDLVLAALQESAL